MRISELIGLLEDMEAEHGDVEVQLQTQQSWPFRNSIRGVVDSVAIAEADADAEAEADGPPEGTEPAVVYIVEGGQIAYGDRAAWEVI